MAGGLSADQQAVLDVLDAEQRTYWSKDFEGFARCYLHDPVTQRWGYSQRGGMLRRQGWDDLSGRVKWMIANAPDLTRPFAALPALAPNIRVSGDMAWATYERHYPRVAEANPGWPEGTNYGLRILERHDGAWKIVFAGILDPGMGDAALVNVAADGRIIWKTDLAAERLAELDDFVVRGGRLRLRDRRADARLQAAIQWAAGVDVGLMGSRGALPVLLDRAAGPMRVCWVMVDAGMILVAVDDARAPVERLGYAANVFQLSPAQLQLAGAIVAGRSLPEFAAGNGVTVNTARTHLRRLFEKVGVNSQPALVRVLLSLSAPR